MTRLLNDDQTDVAVVRPSSYGYAQPDPDHKSHKKKHPIGFAPPKPKVRLKKAVDE